MLGSSVVNVKLATPTGFKQEKVISGQLATVVFSTDIVAYTGGAIAAPSIATTLVDVGTFPGGGISVQTLPPGASFFKVVYDDAAVNFPGLTGNITGKVYQPDGQGFFLIDQQDTQLSATPGAAHNLELYAYIPPLVGIAPGSTVGIPVNPKGPNKIASVSVAPGAGANQDIITASAVGKVLYLYTANIELETAIAAASWSLRDTVGPTTIAIFSTAVAGHRPLNFQGIPLQVNSGLNLLNGGAAAIAIKGTITYRQE